MGPAALLAGGTVAVLLGRTLLGAVARSNAAASSAAAAARRARRDKARTETSLTKKLKRAAELANKGSATPVQSRPPTPPEPPLHPVVVAPPPKPEVVLKDLGQQKTSKKQHAERLLSYVRREVAEGRASGLGTEGSPNATVLQGQRDMGGLKIDGVYGPKVRARGKELTGVEWPERKAVARAAAPAPAPRPAPQPAPRPALPPPAPPAAVAQRPVTPRPGAPVATAQPVQRPGRSPVQAANDLFAFARRVIDAKQGNLLGVKDHPSQTVLEAQRDMGMAAADVDGQYGKGTRAWGKGLIGKTFPGRV